MHFYYLFFQRNHLPVQCTYSNIFLYFVSHLHLQNKHLEISLAQNPHFNYFLICGVVPTLRFHLRQPRFSKSLIILSCFVLSALQLGISLYAIYLTYLTRRCLGPLVLGPRDFQYVVFQVSIARGFLSAFSPINSFNNCHRRSRCMPLIPMQ